MALPHAAKMTVPAGEPAAVAAPPPVAAAAGVVIGPPQPEHGREEDHAVLGELLEDADLTDYDYSSDDDDYDTDDDEYVDSDSEFGDDDEDQPPLPDDDVAPENVVSPVSAGLLGPSSRFAYTHNTAAFMRFALAAAAPGDGGGCEILVHYRYTRFSRAQGGGDGVVTHVLGPKLARVRFHLPAHAAADPASSPPLHLAGAALAPLLYPPRFRAQLRALWCHLVAEWSAPRATPTTRVVVTVDAGILRPGDRTPARMRSMFAAMESAAVERDTQPAAAVFDVGAELLLPAPLMKEDDVRPAKRRRVAGEDCPICCEALDQGLAAWPRCSHIFHATCLEEHLVRGHQECPMCRSGLEVDVPSR